MTCAKQQVFCEIFGNNGVSYCGENHCRNPQPTCPREPGEDYSKCKTICDQVGHAEIDALERAGSAAKGGTAILMGHTYACQACQEALFGAGVMWLHVHQGDPLIDEEYSTH